MTTIYKYRIFCNAEAQWVEGYGITRPTVCYHNNTHDVVPNSAQELYSVSETTVKIDENVGLLGGYYKTQGEYLDIPELYVTMGGLLNPVVTNDTVITVDQSVLASVFLDCFVQITNGTTTGLLGKCVAFNASNNAINIIGTGSPYDFGTSGTMLEMVTTKKLFTQKKDIGVLSFSFNSIECHTYDGLEVHVYPDELIGLLATDLSVGATVLTVSQTVIDNIKVGFYCRLYNGTISECFGEVLEIDSVNNQITIEKPALYAFSSATPTYVRMTVKMHTATNIGYPGPHVGGEDKIGSSLIKKNKSVQVCYSNFSKGKKMFCFSVGHIY